MLHDAFVAPSLRWTVMGAAVVAALAVLPSEPANVHGIQLTLYAPTPTPEPDMEYVYLSVFEDGPVTIATDATQLVGMRFETTARLSDGCTWRGIETLVPADATHYTYTYDEQILSCPAGAHPGDKTPREGIVTVEPYTGHSTRFMM